MHPSSSMDDPTKWEKAWREKLVFFYTELKRTHAGRKNKPLRFVALYDEAGRQLPKFEGSGWESVEKERCYVLRLMERLRQDYVACLGPADRQAKRREFWDRFFSPSAKILEGGRADGNS